MTEVMFEMNLFYRIVYGRKLKREAKRRAIEEENKNHLLIPNDALELLNEVKHSIWQLLFDESIRIARNRQVRHVTVEIMQEAIQNLDLNRYLESTNPPPDITTPIQNLT